MKCVLCGAESVPMCDLKAERPATTVFHNLWRTVGPVCVSHCETFDPALGAFLESELRKWETEHKIVGFQGAGQWSWRPRDESEDEKPPISANEADPDARKAAQSEKMRAYWAKKKAQEAALAPA